MNELVQKKTLPLTKLSGKNTSVIFIKIPFEGCYFFFNTYKAVFHNLFLTKIANKSAKTKHTLPINLNPQKIIKRDDVVVIFLEEGKEGAEEFVGAVAAVVEEDYCAVVEAF